MTIPFHGKISHVTWLWYPWSPSTLALTMLWHWLRWQHCAKSYLNFSIEGAPIFCVAIRSSKPAMEHQPVLYIIHIYLYCLSIRRLWSFKKTEWYPMPCLDWKGCSIACWTSWWTRHGIWVLPKRGLSPAKMSCLYWNHGFRAPWAPSILTDSHICGV